MTAAEVRDGRVVVGGIARGELVVKPSGEALIRTGLPVSCSADTLRAIADLLDATSEAGVRA